VGTLALGGSLALAQPGPLPAAELAKQGMNKYNAGDYAGAVESLQRAVDLEPNNFEYKLALANSLRQSNQCGRARPLYSELVEKSPDDATRTKVQEQMAQCPEPQLTPPPPAPTPPTPPTPPAQPTAVITSSSPGASKTDMFMLMGGGALVGAGIVLLWAGHTHAGDADDARTAADHDRISGRSTAEYIIGGASIAVGVGLSVWAMKRISSSRDSEIAVAFTPREGGGSFVLERSW
jgi:tetratricopeptide (TPR) repeat protein